MLYSVGIKNHVDIAVPGLHVKQLLLHTLIRLHFVVSGYAYCEETVYQSCLCFRFEQCNGGQ
jgi:hypothetical protein